jgi:hypothetical protein
LGLFVLQSGKLILTAGLADSRSVVRLVIFAVELLQHLIFSHQSFFLFLHISLKFLQLVLINLLLELDLSAFFEDFIVLVFALFEFLFILLF